MVQTTYSISFRPFRSNQDGTCQCWSCGGVDHPTLRQHSFPEDLCRVKTHSHTTTTGMLAVLAHTTVSSGHVAAMFSRLGQSNNVSKAHITIIIILTNLVGILTAATLVSSGVQLRGKTRLFWWATVF